MPYVPDELYRIRRFVGTIRTLDLNGRRVEIVPSVVSGSEEPARKESSEAGPADDGVSGSVAASPVTLLLPTDTSLAELQRFMPGAAAAFLVKEEHSRLYPYGRARLYVVEAKVLTDQEARLCLGRTPVPVR